VTYDLRHSANELRFFGWGRSALGKVLMLAYTLRSEGDGERIRIISTRRAAKKERRTPAWKIDFSDIPEASTEQLREMQRVGCPPIGEQ